MPVLRRNFTPDFGYGTCSILARILSNKKHVARVMESGLVLLLIGLMDEVNYYNCTHVLGRKKVGYN